MRHTEFWARMNHHLGEAYAASYAHDQVLAQLDGRTVEQALLAGDDVKQIWRAVVVALELPVTER
ncbi:MAG TPA: DUF3046 domain-containing protein [Actinomycetes bacterium]|nr:DUF3046 domain-containing protein [Actinomycetes bacterium]